MVADALRLKTLPRKTHTRSRSISARTLILHGFLLTIGFVYIYPFIWMTGTSLKTPREFFSQGIAVFPDGAWQWHNFQDAWVRANFSQYFMNTVATSTVSTGCVIVLTSLAAYALARLYLPGKNLILLGLALTFFLPQGYTIIPQFEVVRSVGLLNTLWAVILVQTGNGMIFNTLLFYGYMRQIPHEVEEAAIIDGASVWQRYRHVILPLSTPMIATVGLFTFMNTWNDFLTPLVFTLARPELRTLSVGMYAFVSETSREWTLLCAAATLSIMPVVIVYIFLQRFFIEAFSGAIKA